MRYFRKRGNVCQNCINSNNKKGKWIRRKIRWNHEKGWWHIFCEKKQKYYPWDKYKRCFKEVVVKFNEVCENMSVGRIPIPKEDLVSFSKLDDVKDHETEV